MPNDILTLKSFPLRYQQGFRGGSKCWQQLSGIVLALVTGSALSGCGEEKDTSVTYDDDVRPIFVDRCATCHRANSPIRVDIQNPFAVEQGLVASPNSWSVDFPGETAARNVVPGDPDNSFLMAKISGMGLPANGHGGSQMPPQLPALADDGPEIMALTTWVQDGAKNDAFFESDVSPIFGDVTDTQSVFQLAPNGQPNPSGKCILCHYQGSSNPLDLTNPFGANGLVNVRASYRPDQVRVLPGFPDQSFLLAKVKADYPASEIGAQMPYSYNPLTPRQIATVRQWILEGARP